MAHKIRVILNAEQDVIRDIAIEQSESLEDLHNAITNAFGFTGNEMASFYETDENWTQGEEFPLFDMSDGSDGKIAMRDLTIDNILKQPNDKLIYVYDFFSMWTFYVELIENDFETATYDLPYLLFSLGQVPKNAPEVEFEGENTQENEEDLEDEFDDDFGFDEFDPYMN